MRLDDIIKYRNAWIGFAMLWIVFFHTPVDISFLPVALFKNMGYGGVDICFFASGIGCYYSLNKNFNIFEFAKRRFFRIMPTYLCFIVLWLVFRYNTIGIPFPAIIGNIFGIQNFTGLGGDFNWYISALILFYVIAPYFKGVIDNIGKVKLLLFFLLLICLTVGFWNSKVYIITMARIPIFFLGMLTGKMALSGKYTVYAKEKFVSYLVMLVGVIILSLAYTYCRNILWSHGVYWYPFILITPGLCLFISNIISVIEKRAELHWIKKCLDIVGKNSFEIYLIHIFLFEAVIPFVVEKLYLQKYNNIVWLGCFALLPIIVVCFKLYVKIVIKCVSVVKKR